MEYCEDFVQEFRSYVRNFCLGLGIQGVIGGVGRSGLEKSWEFSRWIIVRDIGFWMRVVSGWRGRFRIKVLYDLLGAGWWSQSMRDVYVCFLRFLFLVRVQLVEDFYVGVVLIFIFNGFEFWGVFFVQGVVVVC